MTADDLDVTVECPECAKAFHHVRDLDEHMPLAHGFTADGPNP